MMKKDRKWFIDKWTKERNKTDVHDPMYHFINEFIADVSQLDEPEVLSQEWIDKHKYRYDNIEVVGTKDLQNLLVPKQEVLTDEQIARKVDQAYKDGYEKGKEHAFGKVGWVDKEPETVADVVIAFWKSYERLKEAMSMEVEEEVE